MRQYKVYCDECKKEHHTTIHIEFNNQRSNDMDFCDRLCLIRWFERNPDEQR